MCACKRCYPHATKPFGLCPPSPAVRERSFGAPLPHRAGLSGESVRTGCSKICRRSVALTTRPFTPLPPLAGRRGLGPSLSPLKGGEGLVSAGIILVDA